MSLTEEQRARLLRAKLSGLVRDLRAPSGDTVVEPATVGASAAVVLDGTAHVLVEDPSPSALGAALAWTDRQGVDALVLLADAGTGPLARWAGYFAPEVQVRTVVGATSEPAVPEPLPPVLPAPDGPDADQLEAQLRDAGLEVVVEQGAVRGEVLGLEVARLVIWPEELGGDGRLHLEAGVGRFDRDAVAAMHQGENPARALQRAVEAVRAHRHPGAPTHPLSLLARERWLRATVMADPALVGAAELHAAEATVPRDSVRDAVPAVATGTDPDGAPVVVVCSVGVDLGLVPLAADARALYAPGARLVLALPSRDRHVVTGRLAAMLRDPAQLAEVPEGWG